MINWIDLLLTTRHLQTLRLREFISEDATPWCLLISWKDSHPLPMVLPRYTELSAKETCSRCTATAGGRFMWFSKKVTNFWILVMIKEFFSPRGSYSVLNVSRAWTRTSRVSAKVTTSSEKSRSVIVVSPDDISQSVFPTVSPITKSRQVLKCVGARIHPSSLRILPGRSEIRHPNSW